MLMESEEKALGVALASLNRVKDKIEGDPEPLLYLKALEISEAEKMELLELPQKKLPVAPVVDS